MPAPCPPPPAVLVAISREALVEAIMVALGFRAVCIGVSKHTHERLDRCTRLKAASARV